MFYILHGPDEFGIARALSSMRRRLEEEAPVGDLNYAEVDGRSCSIADLQAVADALPFMGERRLVVVRGLLQRCGGRGKQNRRLAEALTSYLENVPATTRLVFAEGELTKGNRVLKWAIEWRKEQPAPDETVLIREYPAPSARSLPRWLKTEAERRGGAIAPDAAQLLAEALTREGHVDLRLADSELQKLLTYAGDRPVAAADVQLVVTPVSLESIFELVDALGSRDGPTAATLLHRYLELDEPPLRILAMIVRQFRLLTSTRAMLDAGVPQAEMAKRLPVPPFVVRKLTRQANRFTMDSLGIALRRLRDIDTDIKTGQIDPVLALDLFVASVCGTASRSSAARR